MDIFQMIMNQNPVWSENETIVIIVSMIVGGIFAINLLVRKKITKIQAITGLLLELYLIFVFGSTVFARMPGQRQYELEVFWSWRVIFQGNREILYESLLNIILLLPVGILLPIVIGNKVRWWKGLLIGIVISSSIELLQLILCRGLFEFDDIIHNSIGCMIGIFIGNFIERYIIRGTIK